MDSFDDYQSRKIKIDQNIISLHRKIKPEKLHRALRDNQQLSLSPSSAYVDVCTHAQVKRKQFCFTKLLADHTDTEHMLPGWTEFLGIHFKNHFLVREFLQ